MTALLLFLVLASTYRLTRLITADRITLPIRRWAALRSPFVGYLATCDWCLSIWVAPIPSFFAVAFPTNRLVLFALVALTASAFAGVMAMTEARIDAE